MSQPRISEVHNNRPLTNIAVSFAQSADAFVATQVFPRVGVQSQSDTYYVFPREYWLVSRAAKRAPGAVALRSGYTLSTDNYKCLRDAIGHAIPDPVRRNADSPLSLDANATKYVVSQLMMALEVDWASTFFTTSVWTGSTTGSDITPGTLWDNAASTPIEDIRTQKRAVLEKTGAEPNTLVFGKKCFDNLLDHPDIIDRIKYTAGAGNPAKGSQEILAKLFEVEKLLVCRATRHASAEGRSSPTYDFVAGERNALLCYSAPSPGIDVPSAGYTFTWDGDGMGNNMGMAVKKYRDEPHESDIIEGGVWYDHKVVSAVLGVFFSNPVGA